MRGRTSRNSIIISTHPGEGVTSARGLAGLIVAGRVGATYAHRHGCPAHTSGVAAAARTARRATTGVSRSPWAGLRLVAVCAAAGARRPCCRFLPSACFCGRSLMASAHTARSARHIGFPAQHARQGTQRGGVCSDALARPHETWQLLSVRRIARGGRRRGLRAK